MAAFLAITVACGCGARTEILVDLTPASDATVGTPPADSGADATGRDVSVTPPMDAGVDASDAGFDATGVVAMCITGGFGSVPISQVDCDAGSACIPGAGCVVASAVPLGISTAQCGTLPCATACPCIVGAFVACNCANMP
jgi:hypothetical protein